MLPANRMATHPGVILLEDFLKPARLSQAELARKLRISKNRLNEIIRGKRGVSPETAWKLANYWKTSPEFWMNLQVAHDLTSVPRKKRAAHARLSGQAFSRAV